MNKGTAIILAVVTFAAGYFAGNYGKKGGTDADGGPSTGAMMGGAPLAEQEKMLGPGNPNSDRTRVLVGPNDSVLGKKDALVTVVEFSDFECPYCKRGADVVHQIAKEYPNDVRVVFKHNPLPFHKNAGPASQASLAAGEQGKFWEFHDKLFTNQKALDRATFEKYAEELKLDMAKFKAALDSEKFKGQVEADLAQGARVGARGTPTFFVNGKVMRGAQPFDQFKVTIDAELAAAKALQSKKGLAAGAVYAEIMRDAKPGAAGQGPQQAQPGAPDPAATYKVPVGASASKGKPDALVTIIEFSEFQCPFCTRVLPTLDEVKKKYGDDVRIIFKHNPLPMHPDAPLAAEAALAANEQGKFWEMHDKMFANQKALKRADLEKYAQESKLDLGKFKAALDSGKYKAQVAEDMKLAAQFGVRGTPSFFVNGRPLRGAQPLEGFVTLIDVELAEAKALVAKGTPKAALYETIIKDGLTEVKAAPPQARAGEPDPNAVYKIPVQADAPAKGPATAKVTVVEWSDFQCPFCSKVGPTLKAITEKYPKDVRVVFKQLPLPMHPNAPLAAEASLAANAQGKFWPLHDLMFANQKTLDRANLEQYAQQAGLDVAKFKAALDSGKYKAIVQRDMAEATQFGVRGTPTFFVNGKYFQGGASVEALEARVKEEIVKADKLLASGTRPADLYATLTKDGLMKVAAPAAPAADTTVYKMDVGNSPSWGNPKAPVTIIEFSDFQCPFCTRVVPTLSQIKETYKNDVRIAFKQLPLPMHPDAPLAGEASLAANEQGKFWEMHDKLFANQKALKRADLEKYAQELGLDLGKFKAALDSGKFKQQVADEAKAAGGVGITGTPAFLINGRKLSGAQPFESFKALIDEELAKAKGGGKAAKPILVQPRAPGPAMPAAPAPHAPHPGHN